MSGVGGSEFVFRPPPYQDPLTKKIDFDCICVCVACVRACEAAWARDASGMVGRGQVQFVQGGWPARHPAFLGPAGNVQKPLPCFGVSPADRCKSLLIDAKRVPVASRCFPCALPLLIFGHLCVWAPVLIAPRTGPHSPAASSPLIAAN